jgi:lycopene beta-cyclase
MDVIFVGGGLANGLAAYRLAQVQPECKFLLVEAGSTLGGHHTWSFHATDYQHKWVTAFTEQTWDGHEVHFPEHSRTLLTPYHSMRSPFFHRVLTEALGDKIMLDVCVNQIYEDQVFLNNGLVIQADLIIDGRGVIADKRDKGFQKFLGQYVTLKEPHQLKRPIVMDARVDQLDGYRFVYVLPLSPTQMLVEDTYYSDTPALDEDIIRRRIQQYVQEQGWSIATIDEEEKGVLPIPYWRESSRSQQSFEHTHAIASGMRANLFHPTTGYSFASAVRFADCLAGCKLDKTTRQTLLKHCEAHRENSQFYQRLNNMMFLGAKPTQRRNIMQQFYRRNEGLIFRFYNQSLSTFDRIRMLTGVPPIPIKDGLRTFFQPAEGP